MSTVAEAYAGAEAAAGPTPLDAAVGETQRRQGIAFEAAAQLGVAPDKVCNLLRNVWKTSNGQPPLADHEMFTGMSMIARFGLDPVAKEIYVTRDGKGRLMTIVGIDGWIKAVHRTDHYDGFEQEEGRDDNGKLEWVETRIFSTKWNRPTIYRALVQEYGNLGGYVAKQIPVHMLKLFSFRHAARFFTSLGGVSTEEEARWMARDSRDQAPAASLDDLAGELEAKEKPQPRETPPPPSNQAASDDTPADVPDVGASVAAVDEAKAKLAGAKLIGDCKAIQAEYSGRSDLLADAKADIAELCEARAEEIRGSRGQNSNKPKETAENPPAGNRARNLILACKTQPELDAVAGQLGDDPEVQRLDSDVLASLDEVMQGHRATLPIT